MPDFQNEDKWITLQPNSSISYRFPHEACSAVNEDDGSLPYGATIASATVTATADGTDVTSEIIFDSTIATDNLTVIVGLQYPSTTGAGIYHLTFVITTSDGDDIEEDFNRVMARDK